jgi:hypothetical protein
VPFTINEDFTYILKADKDHHVGYANLGISAPLKEFDTESLITMYMNILLAEGKSLVSISTATLDVLTMRRFMGKGLDCRGGVDSEACNMMREVLHVSCAAHLSTFANKGLSEAED